MPSKTYYEVVYHDKMEGKMVGAELDDRFRGTSRNPKPLDQSVCGHNLLFDLDKKKPLDHDITQEELAKGNYACVDHNGNIRKIDLRLDEKGKQFYTFEKVKDAAPKKPSLGQRFVNFFKSEKNKSPEVKAWNNWTKFQKTAEKRKEYYHKDRTDTPYITDQAEGYSPQDYEKEIGAQKRQAREAVAAEKFKKQVNFDKLQSSLDVAKKGEMGVEMQKIAKNFSDIGILATRISFNELEGIELMPPEEQLKSVYDLAEATVMLHLCNNNKPLQNKLDSNHGNLQKTLGEENMFTLIEAIQEIEGKDRDLRNIVRECRDNGGVELVNKFQKLAAKKQIENAPESKQTSLNKDTVKTNQKNTSTPTFGAL